MEMKASSSSNDTKDGSPPPNGCCSDNAAAEVTESANDSGNSAANPQLPPDAGANGATNKPQTPLSIEQNCLSADTATGLISPLTLIKKKDRPSKNNDSSPTKRFIRKYSSGPGKSSSSDQIPRDESICTAQVDSYAISKIGQAREKIKRSFDRSKLLEHREYVFPRFDLSELTLGEILGRGGFGTVLEIKAVKVVEEQKCGGMFEEKRQIFSIDEFEKEGHTKRKRSNFPFRRHGEQSLRLTKSHDGCEGLSSVGLARISERASTESRLCDYANVDNTSPSAATVEGKKHQKRELRTKALSWSNAKAAAHDVFFHRSPKSHDGEEKERGESHYEQKNKKNTTVFKEEKKDAEVDDLDGDKAQEEKVSHDESIPEEEESGGDNEPPNENKGARQPRVRQVSRNFSFRSWRDSEAGEEGNDAISPEEMEKYSIEPYSAHAGTDDDDYFGTEGADREPSQHSSSGSRRIVVSSHFVPDDEGSNSCQGHQDKTFITQHTTNSVGEARYVIKIISPHIVESDFKKFLQAAMDMATETYFLSVLDHPHILKMRAVGPGDMFSPSYFLVLDRLFDTLSDRIDGTWKQQADNLENSLLVWNRARKSRSLWDERMGVMKDLAGAIAHLHKLKIIYRDVKPENVGFDGKGNVKLFDFGLAKELHEEDECANGTYKLTPNTGSVRYMAPENGNKWPYNFSADSYSFGIMLWEVTALERPFASYTPREIRDMVMKWGERPKLREEWPERVVELMKSTWDSNFRKRPTMEAIEDILTKEIEDSGEI